MAGFVSHMPCRPSTIVLEDYGMATNGVKAQKKNPADRSTYSQIDSIEKFTGTHPQVLAERIKKMNWKFERDLSYNNLKPKDKFKNLIERLTGKRPFDYKNYKIV